MREKIVPIEVTPEMMKMLEICKKNKSINPELYTQYDVKRGLRDINGKGVLAGLTEIGEIHAYDTLSDLSLIHIFVPTTIRGRKTICKSRLTLYRPTKTGMYRPIRIQSTQMRTI